MLSRLATFLIFFFSFLHLFAQDDTTRVKYAATITEADLKKQLTVIASAEMEGRETGTPGQRRAADYIRSQFQALGLKSPAGVDNYLQYFPVQYDSLAPKDLKVGGTSLTYGKDYFLEAGSNDTEEFKTKRIVFAGYGIRDSGYDDYAGLDVKGKTVIVAYGEPLVDGIYKFTQTKRPSTWTRNISRKANLARRKGAQAMIVILQDKDSTVLVKAEHGLKSRLYLGTPEDSLHSRVPVIYIMTSSLKKFLPGPVSDSLLAAIQSGNIDEFSFEKKMKVKLAYKKKTVKTMASNVIGYLEGTDKKDEFVFLTAHYDHLGKKGNVIYYGADDDGSGTSSVIEMAEAFSRARAEGHGPRRTVVFMTVSGEEKGLWGSEYYSDNPVFPLSNTSVDLNTDMVGRVDTERKTGDSLNYIYVIGHDKLSTELPVISEEVNNKFTHLVIDYKFDDPNDKYRIYFRSDHYNFARKGVPVLFFYDGMLLADYHKPTDTVDKINFDLMQKRVRFIFLTAWDMANRDAMLQRDLPIPTLSR